MDTGSELIAQRKQKLDALRAAGADPFRATFPPESSVAEARADPREGRRVRLAGRLMTRRDMGKSVFADLRDETDRIQVYAQKNVLGDEAFARFAHLDLGDILGVEGELFTTRTGELTVKISSYTLVAKALRPPPEKWHGLQDIEARYRQRYLDLISHPEAGARFRQRSRIVRALRRFLDDRGFLEVETPMMQAIAGGAVAKPFVTHHDALGCDLYLRIAPELFLKRLLVGGFERVYEINRNFRNEGISRRHNPEFTMLEVYQAWGDFQTMMTLAEAMIPAVAQEVFGTLDIVHRAADGASEKVIHLAPPWERKTWRELLDHAVAPGFMDWPVEKKREKAQHLGLRDIKGLEDFEVANQVFEKVVQPTLIQPIFVTHLPKELVPLAKTSKEDPATVDVFELCINGVEIAPGYSEQNDPVEQRERLLAQVGHETQKLDEDFLVALEHGMPPAGGMGLGVDRLVMLLTGAESIRDVILFPQLKPLDDSLPPIRIPEPNL